MSKQPNLSPPGDSGYGKSPGQSSPRPRPSSSQEISSTVEQQPIPPSNTSANKNTSQIAGPSQSPNAKANNTSPVAGPSQSPNSNEYCITLDNGENLVIPENIAKMFKIYNSCDYLTIFIKKVPSPSDLSKVTLTPPPNTDMRPGNITFNMPPGNTTFTAPLRANATYYPPTRTSDAYDIGRNIPVSTPPRGNANISPRGNAMFMMPPRGNATFDMPPRGNGTFVIPPRAPGANVTYEVPNVSGLTDCQSGVFEHIMRIPGHYGVTSTIAHDPYPYTYTLNDQAHQEALMESSINFSPDLFQGQSSGLDDYIMRSSTDKCTCKDCCTRNRTC